MSNNECGSYTLSDADPKTFHALDQFYAADRSAVWFIDTAAYAGGPDTYQILGADPSTFTLIYSLYLGDVSDAYTKDRYRVFYYGKSAPAADPSSFALVAPPAQTQRVRSLRRATLRLLLSRPKLFQILLGIRRVLSYAIKE